MQENVNLSHDVCQLHLGGKSAVSMPVDADRQIKDLGRRVAELRANRGLSQDQFAELAEVSRTYLANIEGGRENLTVRSIVKLANLLGVSAAELLHPPLSRNARPGRPPKTTVRPTKNIKGRRR